MKSILLFSAILILVSITHAQNKYPNEIRGYEFFRNEKLQNLEIGVSDRNDIKRIFGEKCEDYCEYDKKWEISFSYFSESDYRTISSDGIKTNYVILPMYAGKLRSIELQPKIKISLKDFTFPDDFIISSVYNSTFGSAKGFEDSFGLKYEIYDGNEKESEFEKGDLILIEYVTSEDLDNKIYIPQQIQTDLKVKN